MIWTDVFGCLTPRTKEEADSPAHLSTASKQAGIQALLGEQVEVEDVCHFCNPTAENFNIILEDERFVVFSDRSPAARIHLLAVPREHIANTRNLQGEKGATLVADLLAIGSRALDIEDSAKADVQSKKRSQSAKETRFGFHIPPFRSVDHLHLHCMALPFKSSLKALKYRIAPGDGNATPPTNKGWGWFVTADQAMAILQAGHSIDVEPC